MLKDFSISIIRTLREHGHQAYLVGGCVRDLLLGREPADYDVTTDATPQEVMRIFPQTYAVGEQFGVVLIPLPKHSRPALFSKITLSSRAQQKLRLDEVSAQSRDLAPNKSHHDAVEVATFRSDIGYSRWPPS